jgi:biotin carboxyl carrier protein
MKMEIDLPAPCAGTVASVPVAAGDLVDPDAELLRIDPADGS